MRLSRRYQVKLSVVISCFNAASTIAIQLEALANQTWDQSWEVVIADNGSTDETLTVVQRYEERLPSLRIVDASGRRGTAHARNVGVLAARGELLAYCDADDEVAPGWLAALGEALSKHDFVASHADLEKLNPSWVLQGKQLRHDGVVTFLDYLPAAAAWGIGIKRSLHEAIGGLDEGMLRLSDIEYSWKAQLMGARLVSVPDALVYYRYPHKWSDIYRKARLDGIHQILLYKKYRPLGMPKLTLETDLTRLRYLIKQFPQKMLRKQDRVWWLREFGYNSGRLQGRIKYRSYRPQLLGHNKACLQSVI
jgi:glycosyltransferase involved in cell wall biosynthesis